MKRESLSGLLLIACAILAMAISNSPFGPVYDHWLQAPLPAGTHMSLLHWINDAVMAVAHEGAMVQHCLPAHRGEEITAEVFEAHADEIFDEAENRLHAQKAVMYLLMK